MHLTFRFITQIRGGLISMLYSKATDVALVDVDAASSLTLMSADVERIVTGMETGHEVRSVPVPMMFYMLECWYH
jgi:ATP-binding cassette subfamily C (CFTR/MRP) protein 1